MKIHEIPRDTERGERVGEETFCSRTKGSPKVEKEGGGERERAHGGRKRTHSRKWLYTTVIDSFPPARTDSSGFRRYGLGFRG